MTVLCRVYLLAVHVASCIGILFDRRSSIFGVYLLAVCVTSCIGILPDRRFSIVDKGHQPGQSDVVVIGSSIYGTSRSRIGRCYIGRPVDPGVS